MTGNEFLRCIKRLGRMRGIAVGFDQRHGKGSHGTLRYGSRKTTLKGSAQGNWDRPVLPARGLDALVRASVHCYNYEAEVGHRSGGGGLVSRVPSRSQRLALTVAA
jgi:hypothetical protein